MSLLAYHDWIRPLREQAEIRNRWLLARLDDLLPRLMARAGLDMWLVIAREYNEDPVMLSLLPQPAMSARRRTILLFYRLPDGRVERLSLDRYGYPGFYEAGWNPEEDAQYEALARHIAQREPETIGLNISPDFAFADGLSFNEHEQLKAALGPSGMDRVRSAEPLAVAWLETRLPEEIAAYAGIVGLGHALIRELYSPRVIHPGVTTTGDLRWWLRETMQALGVTPWFHPSVAIQAPGQRYDAEAPREVILPGDLLWCDVGFNYLGLCTDQQQHAYVRRPGESDAPDGLKAALADANRLQDIHMEQMRAGRTGNEILAETLQRAHATGLEPQVYSHPLGTHGHAAGPTIGLWDRQAGVPGPGDYPLYDDTAYSIELNAKRPIPEWNEQQVRIALEEDAVFTEGGMRWLAGRQTAFHLL